MNPTIPIADLRIAHLHANRDWGGGETQLLALVRRLQARGVFTVLATPPDGLLFARARNAGLRVLPFDRGRDARRQLALDLGEFGLTHLNAHDSGSLSVGIGLRRQFRIPLVLTRRIASPLRRNPFSRWKYSPRRLDGVLAISGTVRDVMVRSGYPAERIQIAPDGVDVDALAAIPPDPDFRNAYGTDWLVGGIGKLSAKKNWIHMVRAAEILAKESFPAQWVLLGDGPEEAALRSAIARAGLSGRFHLLGFRADAARLLRQFDLLGFPSLMEGASVTVREAMAMGVPVVGSDAPGVVESLAGHGWIAGGDEPAAMADAIRQAFQDVPLRQRRIAAARRYARDHYDLDRTVEATLAACAGLPSPLAP